MAQKEGWKQVQEFIENNMNPIEKKLFNDELEKEEFMVLQRERQAYQKVLDFVGRRVEEVKNN